MKRKQIFNEFGTEALEERRMIGGDTTNLFNLNNVKYTWASNMYRHMVSCFWIPEKVDLTDDTTAYAKLTPEEKTAYDGILSFLVFLDSIQTTNLPNVSDFITAPEVSLVLAIQTYQEAIHSQSYAYIIESIIDKEERDTLYEKWRDDETLLERNRYIAQIYQDFKDDNTDRNFMRVLVANFILESIYFYNGFNFFYLLTSRNLMNGTADIIKYINRDELTHVTTFAQIIKSVRAENPSMVEALPIDEINEMFTAAVSQEIRWSQHIIDNVLGMTAESIDSYTKWLANDRVQLLGLDPIYDTEKYGINPYVHLEKIADIDGNGSSKTNFFESTVTSYNQSSAVPGWDF